jgi:hypothetical protein
MRPPPSIVSRLCHDELSYKGLEGCGHKVCLERVGLKLLEMPYSLAHRTPGSASMVEWSGLRANIRRRRWGGIPLECVGTLFEKFPQGSRLYSCRIMVKR